jgi:hypothetical protein
MLRLTNFKAGAQPRGSRNFTGTATAARVHSANSIFNCSGRYSMISF